MIDIIIFKNKVSKRLVVSVMLALSGLYLLVGLGWSGKGEGFRLGVLFGLLTAAAYGGYIATLRLAGSIDKPVDKYFSMLVVCIVGVITQGAAAFFSGESLMLPDIKSVGYLAAYGVLCQAVGWVIISSALPKTRLTVSGLILLLQPALAFTWDVVIFGRPFSTLDIIGAFLVLFAIYLGTIRNVS